MQSHPCLFTFFCQLRMRKCVTVNLICSETSCDFLQYVRNFLHVCSRDTKTLLKKRNLYYNGSPQQVNPFQNVLNPSLLIRLSKYLPKVTPKEFEGKRKGKSGKDETSLFGSKFYFLGKKMRGKTKRQRSLSAVNSIFSQKKKSEGQKKAKKSFGKFQFSKKKQGQKKKQEGVVVKLRVFIHNLLRENNFRKKHSLPVISHGEFVYAIEIILTMKSAFLLFRINNLKRKLFRKKIDIVQSLDFLWKTKNNVFQENISEKRRQITKGISLTDQKKMR